MESSVNCVAWGKAACAIGDAAIALGAGAEAESHEIVLKLEGVPDPVKIHLSERAHEEFRAQVIVAMMRLSPLRGPKRVSDESSK